MGLGDAKLLALAGGWFGWGGAVFALLAGAVQATVITLLVLLVRGVRHFVAILNFPYTAKCVSIKRRQDVRGLQPRSGSTLARSYHDGS